MSNIYSAYQHQSSSFQPERLKYYHLRLLIRNDFLQYAVLSEKGLLMAVKEYRSKSPVEFEQFFDAVYEQDYFLKEEFQSVEVVNNSNEFSLVPTEFFKPQQMREFAGALIKDNFDLDHLEYCDMDRTGATAIYTVPFPMKQKCDHYFTSPRYMPFCQLIINMGLSLTKKYPDLVMLHVFDRQFSLTGFKGGRLHICNAYDYAGVTDMVYFMQLVIEILKLDPRTAKVLLSGEFEDDSDLMMQMRKYVPSVEIPRDAYLDRFETRSEKLPHWKYAFLTY